jgi:hypothetical protein
MIKELLSTKNRYEFSQVFPVETTFLKIYIIFLQTFKHLIKKGYIGPEFVYSHLHH